MTYTEVWRLSEASLCSLYEAEVGAGKHLFLVAHFMLLRAGWGSLVIWYSFYNNQTIFSQSSSLPRQIQKFHKEEAEMLSSYEDKLSWNDWEHFAQNAGL